MPVEYVMPPDPEFDTGSGAFPMTRPAEVVTEAVDPSVSTGAFPSSDEPVTVYQWPGRPPENGPTDDSPVEPVVEEKSVEEADDTTVAPDDADNKSVAPPKRATRARKGK